MLKNNTVTVTPNVFLASVWILLGLVVLTIVLLAISDREYWIVPSIICLGMICIVTGLQRTEKHGLGDSVYRKTVLALAIVCSLTPGVALLIGGLTW